MSRRRRNKREEEEDKKVKKKSGILKKILLVLVLILIFLAFFIGYRIQKNGGGVQGLLLTLVGNDEETLKDLDMIQVLVMGVSTDNGGKLTDTIIIGSYDPKTQKASLLSIPRDTFVGKSQKSASAYDKINALYQKSPEKTLEAVNKITGLDIKYYLVVDNQALIKLVDVIGGVEFDVPIDMIYDDTSQDLHINLKKGLQKIDGEKAEQLLRYRHGNLDPKTGRYIGGYPEEYGGNDIGRMKTQRNFIMETVKQTIKAKNILKIKDIVDIAYEYIETNLPISEIKDYVPYAVNIDIEAMRSEVLPGVTDQLGPQKLWFFVADEGETETLIQDLYTSPEEETESTEGTETEEGSEATDSNGGESSTKPEGENTSDKPESNIEKSEAAKVKIEILNGSGSSKALNEVKKELTAKGYKVTKTNSTTSTAKTTIINKTDVESKFTEDIKSTLGIGNISTSSVSSSKVDITIIIGKDYK